MRYQAIDIFSVCIGITVRNPFLSRCARTGDRVKNLSINIFDIARAK
ncbi:hypothetical protein IMCC9480_2929 [Oxalobacteraceae bacterium IMCC9480]|nr:hypothetical protein IMCC9480_2929 [Oxalobacteraceae bacterium IMCC9480]